MTEDWKLESRSPIETTHLAERLGGLLKANDVLTLEGELGAGKTTFTKGLAQAMGVERTVNSPTFTIMKEYMGRLPFYHMDAYRIDDDMEELGLDEYFEGGGVTVVEWPFKIEDQLPTARLDIRIEYSEDAETRIFYFKAHGSRYETLREELFQP